MKVSYKDQRILITGASAGIGREFARQLASEAKVLVLVARRAERLQSLKVELELSYPRLKVYVYSCDLAIKENVNNLYHYISNQLGTIDILINNAGFGDMCLFERSDWEKLEKMIHLNIRSLTHLCHLYSGEMVAQRKGGILNISSGLGLIFMPGMSVYSASKNYVTSFTEALRVELKGTGVIVSQSCPGPVTTEFGKIANSLSRRKNLPRGFEISASECVKSSLKGFSRGQAIIVPGNMMSFAMKMTPILPRALMRIIFKKSIKNLR